MDPQRYIFPDEQPEEEINPIEITSPPGITWNGGQAGRETMHRMHKILKLHRTNLVQKLTGMSVKINKVEEIMVRAEHPQMGKTVHPLRDTLRESNLIRMEST